MWRRALICLEKLSRGEGGDAPAFAYAGEFDGEDFAALEGYGVVCAGTQSEVPIDFGGLLVFGAGGGLDLDAGVGVVCGDQAFELLTEFVAGREVFGYRSHEAGDVAGA